MDWENSILKEVVWAQYAIFIVILFHLTLKPVTTVTLSFRFSTALKVFGVALYFQRKSNIPVLLQSYCSEQAYFGTGESSVRYNKAYGWAVVVAQVVERQHSVWVSLVRVPGRTWLFGNAINLSSLGVGLSLKNGYILFLLLSCFLIPIIWAL